MDHDKTTNCIRGWEVQFRTALVLKPLAKMHIDIISCDMEKESVLIYNDDNDDDGGGDNLMTRGRTTI